MTSQGRGATVAWLAGRTRTFTSAECQTLACVPAPTHPWSGRAHHMSNHPARPAERTTGT